MRQLANWAFGGDAFHVPRVPAQGDPLTTFPLTPEVRRRLAAQPVERKPSRRRFINSTASGIDMGKKSKPAKKGGRGC